MARISANDSQGNPFKDILSQTIAQSSKVEATSVSTPKLGISRLGLDMPPSPQPSETSQRVSSYLDLLSDYQKQLADSRIPLRTIESVIQRLQNQKTDLQPLIDSLPAGIPLKAIGQQSLILGSLEALRYYKGDYIAG